jgi:hypothetical protein
MNNGIGVKSIPGKIYGSNALNDESAIRIVSSTF